MLSIHQTRRGCISSNLTLVSNAQCSKLEYRNLGLVRIKVYFTVWNFKNFYLAVSQILAEITLKFTWNSLTWRFLYWKIISEISRELLSGFEHSIHLIPPQKKHCPFVSLLICPCYLDPICRIQRNIWLKTRQQGPINMETKKKLNFLPFWNKVYVAFEVVLAWKFWVLSSLGSCCPG